MDLPRIFTTGMACVVTVHITEGNTDANIAMLAKAVSVFEKTAYPLIQILRAQED